LEGEGGKPDKLLHANRYVLTIECPHPEVARIRLIRSCMSINRSLAYARLERWDDALGDAQARNCDSKRSMSRTEDYSLHIHIHSHTVILTSLSLHHQACVFLDPSWPKGHLRLGTALKVTRAFRDHHACMPMDY
jgi:hypothetical protein